MNQSSNVQVLSKELIKPSSPTPGHLKTFKLSFLDQLWPFHYSLIFFYDLNCTTDHGQISQHLKQSLSKTLTLYYPLAGKIDATNFLVDCDDNGVEFIEARSHSQLKDVMHETEPDELKKYVPASTNGGIYMGEGTIFMAQITFFDCGGIAIGVSIHHQIADGWSLVEFMNAWAAICRGENPKFAPEFGIFARHFPARDVSFLNVSASIVSHNDEFVIKRFVFGKEKLETLKEVATSEVVAADFVKNPTGVEVVTAFIWKQFIENKGKINLAAHHPVNIRSRAGSSLHLEKAFGNGTLGTIALNDGVKGIPQLVSKLRRAIRTIDDEYISKSCSEELYVKDIGRFPDLVLKGECLVCTSWCGFPVYEVNFGWGIPVRVTPGMARANNGLILMKTKNGDGIEAWTSLFSNDIESLENQFKLIGIAK